MNSENWYPTRWKLTQHFIELGGNWRTPPFKLGGNWRDRFATLGGDWRKQSPLGGNWREKRWKLARFPIFETLKPLILKGLSRFQVPSPYSFLILKIYRTAHDEEDRAGSAPFLISCPYRADFVGKIIWLDLRQGKSLKSLVNRPSRQDRSFCAARFPICASPSQIGSERGYRQFIRRMWLGENLSIRPPFPKLLALYGKPDPKLPNWTQAILRLNEEFSLFRNGINHPQAVLSDPSGLYPIFWAEKIAA